MSFGWRSEDQPGSASRVVQEGTDLSAKDSGQHFFKFSGAHALVLLRGRLGATERERALSVPRGGAALGSYPEPDPRGREAWRDPGLGWGARRRGLTCQAGRHGGGQQQQQQQLRRRRGRRLGQPEGHRSAAATSARLDGAAGSGSCWKSGSRAGSVAPVPELERP